MKVGEDSWVYWTVEISENNLVECECRRSVKTAGRLSKAADQRGQPGGVYKDCVRRMRDDFVEDCQS